MPRDQSPARPPSEPWLGFLTDLDAALEDPADFHCIGGFVVSQHYGFARETADLDVLTVIPPGLIGRVAALAGLGSPLHKKHRVHIDHVGIASYPDDYQTRLVRIFPLWPYLRPWAVEPHDLALTKLERSNDRDIRDVMYLAQTGWINRQALISRFERELEPYLTGRTPTWNRTTLQMWVEACWPETKP